MTFTTYLFWFLLVKACWVTSGITSDSVTNTPTDDTMGPGTTTSESSTTDMTLQNMFDDDPCNTYGTCAFVNTSDFKHCNCDGRCHEYNDCCFNPLTEATTHDSIFDCLDSDSLFSTPGGYFVIAKCLNETFKPDLHAKCESDDIVSFGPWVYGNNGVIYKNKHCAECNGLTSFQSFSLRFYNVHSTFVADITNATQEERFNSLVTKAKNARTYRNVWYLLISPVALDSRLQCLMTEPITNTSSRNCRMYSKNPVIVLNNDDDGIYHNIYCVPTLKTKDAIICANWLVRIVLETNMFYDVHPLNILFSFGKKSSGSDCDKIDELCRTDEIYKNTEVIKTFSLLSNATISDLLLKKVIFSLAWSLLDSPNVTILKSIQATKAEQQYNSSSLVLAHISVTYILVKEFRSKDIIYHINKIEKTDLRMRIKFNTSSTLNMLTNTFSAELYAYCWPCFIEHKFKSGENIDLFLNNQLIRTETNVTNSFCDSVSVETIFDEEEASLTITNVRCMNFVTDTFSTLTTLTQDDIGTLITYAGTSVSIILLIISVMVNKKAGMSRSVPGGNVQNLSVSLIIANILFVTGIGANDYQTVCLVVGVLLHYFWLLVFSFMSVTIVYMFRNMKGMIIQNTNSHHDTLKAKVKLTTLGLFLPFIFTVPSCVLEYLGTTHLTPHYTGNICFPTSYPANLVFVSGPIMISVAINMFCLVGIIMFLYKHKEQTKHIKVSQTYQQIPVYLRMSVLTGGFWVFGIIGAVFDSEVMNFMFIIICSLQGFMIAVSNLTTKAIKKELRSKKTQNDLTEMHGHETIFYQQSKRTTITS